MKIKIAIVILLACFLANAQQQSLWRNGIGHSSWEIALNQEDAARMLSLWNEIGADLKRDPRDDLPGTYVKGGYSNGYFLRWSFEKGFVVIPYFDQNLITDFGYGTVTKDNSGEIIFTSERQLNGGRGLDKMPERWIPLENYFVPVESLEDFGLYQAGLGVYNEFNGRCCEFAPEFLATRIDGEQTTYPVPDRYKHFIRSPLNGKIIKVGKSKRVRNWWFEGELYSEALDRVVLIPITVDIGRKHGMKPNTLLRISGEPDYYQYVQIVKVEQSISQGYVVRTVTDSDKETYRDSLTREDRPLHPIRVGMIVTSALTARTF